MNGRRGQAHRRGPKAREGGHPMAFTKVLGGHRGWATERRQAASMSRRADDQQQPNAKQRAVSTS